MKEKIRKKILAERKNIINKKALDLKVLNNLQSIIKDYDKIMIYYPLSNEPNIFDIVNIKGKNFYLPFCKNKNIEVRKFTDVNSLVKDEQNILSSNIITTDTVDIVIVPAVAMNKRMYRLGYGGGYYDRFFKNYCNVVKVAVVYEQFIIDDDYQDSWDISFDYIVTENQVLRNKI